MAEISFIASDFLAHTEVPPEPIRVNTLGRFKDCRFGVYGTHIDENGEQKKTVGFNPRTKHRYSPNRPETSLSFDEAVEEAEFLNATTSDIHGLILYMPDNLVCVDFDGTEASETDPDLRDQHHAILASSKTWIEKSVSDVGYHAFYAISPEDHARLTNTNNADMQIDTRITNGFIFLTGKVLKGYDVDFAPYEDLNPKFREYLRRRCELALESRENNSAQWLDAPKKSDVELVKAMYKHCPRTAEYLFTRQDQSGGSEKHFSALCDLIQYSQNYEQVKRIYLASECAEYGSRSENRNSQTPATYEKWLTRNIQNAAQRLCETAQWYDPDDILIDLNDRDDDAFTIQWTDEVTEYSNTEWIVENIIPAKGVVTVYGASGTGKTFLTLDMLMAVANGIEWFGHKTMSVPVTYVGLEGEAGLKNRVFAYRQHHKEIADLGGKLALNTDKMNILDSADQEKLLRMIYKNNLQKGIVVIDTMSKSAPGMEENSSSDMSKYIAAVEGLAAKIDGCVLLVHHSGKDGERGPRGSSAFLAGIDAAIQVTRDSKDKSGTRSWSTKKVKDGGDDAGADFQLVPVVIGKNQWGDDATSCVVERAPEINLSEANESGVDISDEECMTFMKILMANPTAEVRNKGSGAYTAYTQFNELPDWPRRWNRERTKEVVAEAIARNFVWVEKEIRAGNTLELIRPCSG